MVLFLLLFSLVLKKIDGVRIYVTNARLQCEQAGQVCDGNFSTPFGTLISALKFAERNILEDKIEISLNANTRSSPYLILDSDIDESLDFFSPFLNFSGSSISIAAAPNENPMACISLRTERLVLDVRAELLIENLAIEGRDLPVSKSNSGCLRTSAGCCPNDKMYFQKESPCFIYGRTLKEGMWHPNGKKYYSLINGEGFDAVKSIFLTNFTLEYFNPTDRYVSLISLKALTSIQIVNVSLEYYFLSKALIVFTSERDEAAISGIELFNFSEKNFNPFFIQLKKIEKPLILIESYISITLASIRLSSARTQAYIFSFTDCEQITISKAMMSQSHGAFLDLQNNRKLTINNTIASDIKYVTGRLAFFIQISNVLEVTLINLTLNNLKLNPIISPILLNNVMKLRAQALKVAGVVALKTGSFELINVAESDFLNCSFLNIRVSIAGTINFLENGAALRISNSSFTSIAGARGAIFGLAFGSHLSSISIQSTWFVGIDCQNSFCLDVKTNKFSSLILSNLSWSNIKGGQHLLSGVKIDLYYSSMFFVSIKELLVRDSAISLFNFDARLLVAHIENVTMINCTAKKYLFFEIYSFESIFFEQINIINCSNNDLLGLRFDDGDRSNFVIRDSNFENIAGDASLHIYRTWGLLQNVKFSRTSGKTYAFFLYGVSNFLNFIEVKFYNHTINVFSGVFLTVPNRFYSFVNCLFFDIHFVVTGSLIMLPNECGAVFTNCTFGKISGRVTYLIGMGNDVTVLVTSTKFLDFKMAGSGGIFFMLFLNRVIVLHSYFSNIQAAYNGLIAYIELESTVYVNNCQIKNIFGNSGGAFFLRKHAILYINQTFIRNVSSLMNGGIISGMLFTAMILANSLVSHVSSSSSGGVLYFEGQLNKGYSSQVILRSSHFEKVSCRQDGALGYLTNIDQFSAEKINVYDAVALNAGGFFLENSRLVSFAMIFFSAGFAYEKAGFLWAENIEQIAIVRLESVSCTSKSFGVLFFISDSFLKMTDVSVTSSIGPSLTHLKNSKSFSITIQGFSLNASFISVVFDMDNKLENSKPLLLNISQFLVSSNTLESFLIAVNSHFMLTDGVFKNNTEHESHKISPIIDLIQGTCLFHRLSFVQNFFTAILGVNSAEIVEINATTLSLSGNFLVAKSNTIIRIHDSNITVSVRERKNVALFTFSANSWVSLMNFHFQALEELNPPGAISSLIQSINGSLVVEGFLLDSFVFEAGLLFDFKLKEGDAISFIDIKVYEFQSVLGVVSIQVTAFSLCSIKNFLVLSKRKPCQTCRFLVHVYSRRNPLASSWSAKNYKSMNISDAEVNASDFTLRLSNIESPIMMSNFKISFKTSSSSESSSALDFQNCHYLEAQTLTVSEIEGQSGLEFKIYQAFKAVVLLKNSNFSRCRSRGSGGALFFLGSIEFEIYNSRLINNSALLKGGALYIKNYDSQVGSFHMEDVTIAGNKAEMSASSVSYITRNVKMLKSLDSLAQRNRIDAGHMTATRLYQVASQPVGYKIILSSEGDETKFFSSDEERIKISTFSGKRFSVELEFFDAFKQPNFDFVGSRIKCEANASERLKNSLIFFNNEVNILSSKVNFTRFEIVTRNKHIKSTFSCRIIYEGPGAGDFPQEYFSTAQIEFEVQDCQIGQILRENRCATCENSYSLETNITVFTSCFTCPSKSNCSAAHIKPFPGYWNLDTASLRIIKCHFPLACLGGVGAPCAEGYSGKVCASCDSGRGKAFDSSCIPCSDHKAILLTLARVLVLYSMTTALCLMSIHASQRKQLFDLILLIRQVIDFAEVFSIVFSVNFSDAPLFDVIRGFNWVWSFYGRFGLFEDCFTESVGSQEHRFLTKAVITLAIPLAMSLAAGLTVYKIQKSFKSLRKYSLFKILLVSLGISLFHFFSQILKELSSIFYCDSFSNDHAADKTYLIQDPDILCHTPQHFQIIMIPVLSVTGFYALILLLLHKMNRRTEFIYFRHSFQLLFRKGSYDKVTVITKFMLVLHTSVNRFNEKMAYISFYIVCLMVYLLLCVAKDKRRVWSAVIALNYIVIYVDSLIFINVGKGYLFLRDLFPFILTVLVLVANYYLIITEFYRYFKGNKTTGLFTKAAVISEK